VEWRKSSFLIQHRFLKGESLAVDGIETRVWTGADAGGRMKARPIPQEIVKRFSREVLR
jgi:hypothetical protein